MKQKITTLMKSLAIGAIAIAGGTINISAQDAVHGVDGYYNFTAAQMQASGAFSKGTKGAAGSNTQWHHWLEYQGDYAIYHHGLSKTDWTDSGRENYIQFEGCPIFGNTTTPFMTVTGAYPIIVIKYSIPYNNLDPLSADPILEPIFTWFDPRTNGGEGSLMNDGGKTLNYSGYGTETQARSYYGNHWRLDLAGFDTNGRRRIAYQNFVDKQTDGRDSLYLDGNKSAGWLKINTNDFKDVNGNYVKDAEGKNIKDTTMIFVRVPKGYEDGKADFIFAFNTAAIRDQYNEGKSILDEFGQFGMRTIELNTLNVRTDTIIRNEAGDSIGKRTAEQLPITYIKWLKTFSSVDEFLASLTEENNFGDGQYVNPQKEVLNTQLYETRQAMKKYKFSDQVSIIKEAYDAAVVVYNNPEATTSDYDAQIAALKDATDKFLVAITFDASTLDKPMSKFMTYDGSYALGISSQTITTGGFTGHQLELVEADQATDFLFVANGTDQVGQKMYNLKTSSETMVQTSDGTLLFVNPSQLSNAGQMANVIISNRGASSEEAGLDYGPAYDFKVGADYYYYDMETGELTSTTDFPADAEEIDEIANYLFTPLAVEEYDPDKHDNEKYPMTQGEGSAWEFNEAIVNITNPAYESSFNTYEWDADSKTAALARAQQPTLEGWRCSGWNMRSLIEAVTLSTAEKCMKVSVMNEYDDLHADSVAVTLCQTDWSTPQSVSIMREHGAYNSALNRAPINNQQLDSLYYNVYLNSGISRYFAVKYKATNPDIKYGGIDFFVRKGIEEPKDIDGFVEQRGDVYVFDLLTAGVPMGDRICCGQYLSWTGFTSKDDAVYVDWMRFYNDLDAIPSETMTLPTTTGIDSVDAAGEGSVRYYNVSGMQVTKPQSGITIAVDGKKIYKLSK